jgi:hypothetical protein
MSGMKVQVRTTSLNGCVCIEERDELATYHRRLEWQKIVGVWLDFIPFPMTLDNTRTHFLAP